MNVREFGKPWQGNRLWSGRSPIVSGSQDAVWELTQMLWVGLGKGGGSGRGDVRTFARGSSGSGFLQERCWSGIGGSFSCEQGVGKATKSGPPSDDQKMGRLRA